MSDIVYFFVTKVNNDYYKNGKKIQKNSIPLSHLHISKEDIFKSKILVKEISTVYMDQYEGIPLILAKGKKKKLSSNYKIIEEEQLTKEHILRRTDDKLFVEIALNDLNLKAYKGEPYTISEIVASAQYALRAIENKDSIGQLVSSLPTALSEFIENERKVPPLSVGTKLKHRTKGYVVKVVPPFAPAHRYLVCLAPESHKSLNLLLEDIYCLNPHHRKNTIPILGKSFTYITERMNLQFSEVHSLFDIMS
jgi:hypothetical protein